MTDTNEPSDEYLRALAYGAGNDKHGREARTTVAHHLAGLRAVFNAGRTFERSQQAERSVSTHAHDFLHGRCVRCFSHSIDGPCEPSPHPVMTSATGEGLVSWVAEHGDVVLDALDLYRWQLHAAGALAVELRALLLACGRASEEKEEEKLLPAWKERPDAEGWWLRLREGKREKWFEVLMTSETGDPPLRAGVYDSDRQKIEGVDVITSPLDDWFGPVRVPPPGDGGGK